MKEKIEIYPFDKEWREQVESIMENGGTLWCIERTDTNQFMIRDLDLKIRSSDDLPEEFNPYEWKDVFPTLIQAEYGKLAMFNTQDLYPSKELADRFAPKEIREGGCPHCGHGSVIVPIQLIEHEFMKPEKP